VPFRTLDSTFLTPHQTPWISSRTKRAIRTLICVCGFCYARRCTFNDELTEGLPSSQIIRLQLILNVRVVTKTPIMKSLHWLNINPRILYKILYLTHKHCILGIIITFAHSNISSNIGQLVHHLSHLIALQ
jgi:hypothetical protein